MTITATDRNDYIRDIVITMPGGICEGDALRMSLQRRAAAPGDSYHIADNSDSIIFYPGFLNRLRAYSVLRFMDWMATNNSPVTNWSQRTLISYRTWTKSAVCLSR